MAPGPSVAAMNGFALRLADLGHARPVIIGLARQLSIVAALLLACGFGFWLVEPTTPTLPEALWLAFVTASTIGYGDYVPTTQASRMLAVPVLLLGFAMLSMVTAAVAAMWVGSQERTIEREILRDLHRQIGLLRLEIQQLRAEQTGAMGAPPSSERQPM